MSLQTELDSDEFDAFICYSRKDIGFARRLEKTLEAFRPPSTLPVPHRRLRIFRDEGDISGVEYYQAIDKYLERSSRLIVVCSPNARVSDYVGDEISRFAKAKGKDNIVPILLEGIPNNEAHDEDRARMAFPDSLYELMEMPLATSFVGFEGHSTKIDRGAFEASWFTLLSNLYEVSREEIEQRERRRRRRTQLIAGGAVVLVIAALATLAVIALLQANEAEQQRAVAEEQRHEAERQRDIAAEQTAEAIRQRDILHARQLAFQAQSLLDTGIGNMQSRGALLAIEAMRRYPSSAATGALQTAIQLRRPLLWEGVGDGLGPGTFMAFSPDDNRLVAVGDHETPARVLETETGREVTSLGVDLNRVDWDPNGAYIAGATRDAIILWSAVTYEEIGRVQFAYPEAIAFSQQGDRLAASRDGTRIQIWELPGLRPVRKLNRSFQASYPSTESLSFHPDGDMLAVATSVGDSLDPEGFGIDIWSVARGRILRRLEVPGSADWATFSADGAWIAIGVAGAVRVFATDTWIENRQFELEGRHSMVSVNFDRRGEKIAAVGWDAPACIWRFEDGAELARLEHERLVQRPGRVTAITLSPSGRYAATIGEELRVWLLDDATKASKFDGHSARSEHISWQNWAASILLFADEGYVISGDQQVRLEWDQNTVRIVDTSSKAELENIALAEPAGWAELSETGRFFVLINKTGTATVYDRNIGGKLAGFGPEPAVRMAAISESASILALVLENNGVLLHPLEGSDPPRRLLDGQAIRWVTFSASGKWMLASLDGALLIVVDVATGLPVATLNHDRPVTNLLFTADEGHLATASSHDGTARIWNLANGETMLQWYLETNLRWVQLGFSNDERLFRLTGMGHDDSSSTLIDMWRHDDLIEAACKTVNRPLSEREWRRYFPESMPYRQTCR